MRDVVRNISEGEGHTNRALWYALCPACFLPVVRETSPSSINIQGHVGWGSREGGRWWTGRLLCVSRDQKRVGAPHEEVLLVPSVIPMLGSDSRWGVGGGAHHCTHPSDRGTEAEHSPKKNCLGAPSRGLTGKTGLGVLLALPSLGEHSP